MSKIRKTVETALAAVPRTLLKKKLSEKLAAQGIDLTPELLENLAEHVLSNPTETFTWDAPGDDRSIVLHFTPEDVAAIEQGFQDVLISLPDIMLRATDRSCESVVRRLRARWPAESILQDAELANFRSNLEDRWGEGLDYLRMLLTACREVGQQTQTRQGKSKSRRRMYRRWVLGRLYARACQVTDEIVCLLENGFADGAFARWRTLHELSIVAMLIADGDEDLAERYIAHDAVEVKRQADDYQSSQVPIGAPPFTARRLATIDRQYDHARSQYGEEFRYPYGWAAKHLKHKKPTFKELQEHAKRSATSSHYKLASFNVHASARSLFFNLSSMLDEVVVAGRSNAGLAEPGCMAAYALVVVTGCYAEATSLERSMDINVLVRLRDLAESAFRKAERSLERDERAIRTKRTERRKRASGTSP